MSAPWQAGESPFQVTIRDPDLHERTSGKGYTWLRAGLRYVDVGEWTLELPERHPGIGRLMEEGAGIVVRPAGQDNVIFSGSTRQVFRTIGGEGGITAIGLTDEAILAGERCFPDPTQDVSTAAHSMFTASHDVRTGPAEDALTGYVGANIGPAAGIVRRRYPWLTVPVSAGRGTTGRWEERFTTLLDAGQRIARYGGLGFRVVQGTPGNLEFQVYEPVDRPRARFSVEAGNLTSAVVTFVWSTMDEMIVGGPGELSARVFTRRPGTPGGWYRQVGFLDQTHTEELAQHQQDADERLIEAEAKSGIKLHTVEQPGLRYGVHYQLGDLAHAYNLHKRVEMVVLEHGKSTRTAKITPSIGVPDMDEISGTVAMGRRLLDDVGRTLRR